MTLFHVWYNNIKIGTFWCQSNLHYCLPLLRMVICRKKNFCRNKERVFLYNFIYVYWVLITPKNFIFTPLGVIYPGSPTTGLDNVGTSMFCSSPEIGFQLFNWPEMDADWHECLLYYLDFGFSRGWKFWLWPSVFWRRAYWLVVPKWE
jgi:hypothetical protein